MTLRVVALLLSWAAAARRLLYDAPDPLSHAGNGLAATVPGVASYRCCRMPPLGRRVPGGERWSRCPRRSGMRFIRSTVLTLVVVGLVGCAVPDPSAPVSGRTGSVVVVSVQEPAAGGAVYM